MLTTILTIFGLIIVALFAGSVWLFKMAATMPEGMDE